MYQRMQRVTACTTTAVLLLVLLCAGPYGVHGMIGLELDQFTLAKLIGGENDLLVQFVSHAYERVQGWDEETELHLSHPNFIAASIHVKEPPNAGVDKTYGLSEADFPTFVFFPRGRKEGPYESISGSSSTTHAHEPFSWAISKSVPALGELRKLASSYVAAEDRDAIRAHAGEIVGQLAEHSHKKIGDVYVKVMDRINAVGPEFLATEAKRVTKLIQNDNTVPKQKRDLRQRNAVLSAFGQQILV
eukprot:TRINITY_DN17074_c0_g1_i1.p1 TRINITY_DN17074_c0_g1~~TRINITY_DN17074_c0_g1_i1.p1  ORF type:complete len:246 (+),score=40.27 TRINITY_DN17074_c0_g1_i1:287-1024(+)